MHDRARGRRPRRMMARWGAPAGILLATVVAGVGLVPLTAAPATAADIGYRCQIAREGFENAASASDVTLGLVLQVPGSAEPGDRFTPSGDLTVSIAQPSRGVRSLGESAMDSRGLALGARSSAGDADLPANWKGTVAESSTERVTLTGAIALPSYRVPKTDEVVFRLPSTNRVAATVGGGQVAFNLELTGNTFLGPATYLISCAAPQSTDTSVGRTAVVTPTPTPTANPTDGSPGDGGAGGTGGTGGTGSTGGTGGATSGPTSGLPGLFPDPTDSASQGVGTTSSQQEEFGLDELGDLFATAAPGDAPAPTDGGLGAPNAGGPAAPDASEADQDDQDDQGDQDDIATVSDDERRAGFDMDRVVQLGFGVAWAAVAYLAWTVWRRRRMAPTREL